MQPDQARLLHAQAGMAQMQLQEEQAFANALQQSSSTPTNKPTDSPADQLMNLSSMAFKVGAVQKGMTLMKDASLMKYREVEAVGIRARAELSRLTAERDKTQFAATHAVDIRDDTTLAEFNNEYESRYGETSPYRMYSYSPGLVDHIQNMALTYKDQLDVGIKSRTADINEFRAKETARQNRARDNLYADRTKALREREARLGKGGDRPAGTPTVGEVKAAGKLIQNEFPDIDLTSPEGYNISHAIASRAKQLQSQNRALSADQALTQAYLERKAEGDFQRTEPGAVSAWFGAKGKTTVRSGDLPARALPLPADKKLKSGKWYNTSRSPARWTGKEFTTDLPTSGGGGGGGEEDLLAPEPDEEGLGEDQ